MPGGARCTRWPSGRTARLLTTVGHGTLESAALAALLSCAGIELVVDVRTYPASRRNPHFAREQLERSLPAAGIGYRWEPRLGGFRTAGADSPNVALRHPSFRGYADHMATPAFRSALDEVLAEAGLQRSAVMCSESLWWRCHRRLIADAATLLRGVEVVHLGHDGHQSAHRPTDGARVAASDLLVYDAGQARLGDAGPGEAWPGEPAPEPPD